ncbi:MFS transporter [Paenibacillus whitsoniae]|uniref:MFS transporter n=1 Tax=Paenibacillus whitsoniae TaxID=2496558 RepID=A0A3S0C9M5_9BACL|nr:MFS transporter [Paenibacillus whitsoniae]RTE09048.1 MFS transporter [Paenibacillus whitsoniae]
MLCVALGAGIAKREANCVSQPSRLLQLIEYTSKKAAETMQLSGAMKRLLLMNAASTIIFNYIGIFVNLFIWEKNNKISEVVWFNLVLFVMWTLAFGVGSRLLTSFTTRALIRSNAICGGLVFLLLSTLELDNRLLWIAIIAMPIGIMWGFYASAQNITLSVFGKGRDFEQYFSMSNIINQVISIVNPIAFALIIKWIGYSGSFLLMFLFVALLMAVSFFIPTITLAGSTEKLFQGVRFRLVFSTSALRWMVPSLLAAGVFLQFQMLFALVFTFSVSEDKLIIALFNVLYASSAIGAMMLYRRLHVKEGLWLKIGMTFLAVGILLPLLPKAPILILSNLFTTIGMFYFGTVWNTRQFRIISKQPAMQQARIFLWREGFLNVSRIALLVVALSVQDLHGGTFYLLIALALVCAFIVPVFSGKSTEMFERQGEAGSAESR